MVLSIFVAMLMILSLYAMYSMGQQSIEKIKLQNTADAAAYSAAVAEARDYNFSAYTNRAMVANQVAVAQFVGLTSWMRNMSAFANGDPDNAGRDVYQIFLELGSTPLSNIYKKFLKGFGKITGLFDEGSGGSTFMGYAITVMDGLIKVYGESQKIYHYGTALTVAETLGAGFGGLGKVMANLTGVDFFTNFAVLDGGDDIVNANDPKAHLTITGGLPYLVWHMYKWYNFTESKDPNTDKGDGPDADRFAQVTMDSLDDFSRDRSTKPAWGFYFFYAPPLTYIDPTRFIPQPWTFGPLFLPVIHRGGTELKLTDASGSSSGATPNPVNDGSGLDCHGNPVQAQTSGSGGISVGRVSALPAAAASCPGDSASVSDNDNAATNPPGTAPPGPNAGVYAFDGTSWNKVSPYPGDTVPPSNPGNPQGDPHASNTSTSTTAGRGAAGSKSKKTWTALDASSWAGLHIFWFVIPVIFVPVPLPIPFAPPWIPLSHGAAQSGKELTAPTVLASDNNFGSDASQAYGEALDSWTTKMPAEMAQKNWGSKVAAGHTLEKVSSLGGLTNYRDVKDVDPSKKPDNLVSPALVVEIEKNIDDMPKSPGSDQFALLNGAPMGKHLVAQGQYMRALSKSEVYFGRPTNDSALDWFKRVSDNPHETELGSLYNPYWQPRLAANNFVEQYVSMEIHRAGF
jgi:hypothetical protein